MVKIIYNNKYAYIRGATPREIDDLEKTCSYLVAGFMFSKSFKNKRWNGRESLLNFIPRKGHRVPIGLLEDVVNYFKKARKDFKMVSKKRWNQDEIVVQWNNSITLRPYQVEAVETICGGKKWQQGSGLIKLPTGAGKTKTAAGVIYRLKRKTLFVVPSQMLLNQTVESLSESLCTEIGMIGDGKWDVKDITVATIQTLARHAGGPTKVGRKTVELPPDEQFLSLANVFDILIMDEIHHAAAITWRNVANALDVRCRIGLSATIEFDNKREMERGVIWLKACCGNIRYEVETSYLIDNGYLMRQDIEIVPIRRPMDYFTWRWCKALQEALIYENVYRNEVIVKKAIEKLKKGLKVLIISNRYSQLIQLCEILRNENVSYAALTSFDTSAQRKEKVNLYLSGEYNLILGSVFGEGVDIPAIEVVINAEGGRDIKNTIQRMRNLRLSEGKTTAIFIDFADMTNKYFAAHSKDRIDVYRKEPSFTVKIVEP